VSLPDCGTGFWVPVNVAGRLEPGGHANLRAYQGSAVSAWTRTSQRARHGGLAPLNLQVTPPTASLEAVLHARPHVAPQEQQNCDAGSSHDGSSGQMYKSRRS